MYGEFLLYPGLYYYLFFLIFKIVVKYIWRKITMVTILKLQFIGIKSIHIVVQPPWLFMSRTFSSSHTKTLYSLNNNFPGGLPWWSSGKESNEGDAGWIPDWGTKTPHVVGQLSLCVTTREACIPQWRPSIVKNRKPQLSVTLNGLLY